LTNNSVLKLRIQELAKSTREFKTRGSRVIRCELCLLRKVDCICAARPVAMGNSAFCFILYKSEVYKPSNTGRLIADVIADNHAFLWDRTRPDPQLLALLANDKYAPVLLFPHQYAEAERCIHHLNEVPTTKAGRIPLYVMLDGTWREAKKMFKSPYLAALPVLSIQPQQASAYLLRDGAHAHQLCTAEIAIEVLKLTEDSAAAAALADYFALFCRNYIAIKPYALEKIKLRAGIE